MPQTSLNTAYETVAKAELTMLETIGTEGQALMDKIVELLGEPLPAGTPPTPARSFITRLQLMLSNLLVSELGSVKNQYTQTPTTPIVIAPMPQ